MINTRTATLLLKKDGRSLAASRIMLHSRAAGAYLEADLSVDEKVAVDDVLQVVYDNGEGESRLVATVRVFTIPPAQLQANFPQRNIPSKQRYAEKKDWYKFHTS